MRNRLVMKPRTTARARLFCFPSAGMGASMYRGWHDAFPEGVQVAALQWPGRESRFSETPLSSVAELVDHAVEIIRPYLDLPYALFGHSMGAIVAYETANRLRAEGIHHPIHIFACSHSAPQLSTGDPRSAKMTDEELVEHLHGAGGVGEEFLESREYLNLMLPAIRADLLAVDTYLWRGDEPHTVPITAIAGQDDIWASPEALQAWKVHTASRFSTRIMAGGHHVVRDNRTMVIAAVADDITLSMALSSPDERPVR
ncbi:medium-chain acyl-[acyl-carrier-protein] hydrolase [Catenulispora sp. EB89]